MNPDESSNWLILYRKALLEPDTKKSKARIAEAQTAIRLRARELWYSGTQETTERLQMDAASHFLGLLRNIGDEQS